MKFIATSIAVPLGAQRYIQQFILVMKITTFLLMIGLMQVSAKGYSQISLHEKNASLEKVFTEIKKQTNYVFLYDERQLNLAPLSIDIKNATLEITLAKLFKDLPVEYSIVERNVLIKPKQKSILTKIKAYFDEIDVRGHVVDKDGNPLAGATISWPEVKGVMTTDSNGDFFMRGVDEKTVFVISYVGYLPKKIKVKPDLGTIKLELLDSKLDEVQVIAYGTNTRRFSVGSAVTVTAQDIEQQPVTNVLLALEGRVPGLTVTPNGGAPGASAKIQIRGQNSLNSNINSQYRAYDQPLFIIDGVPFAPQNNKINISQRFGSDPASSINSSTATAADGMSPFNTINPSDIESITVLKDADATSIYGSQGSNGVILITTKKGKAGQTTLDAHVDRSVNFVARPIQMLNTQQYLDMRHEAIKNDEIPADQVTSDLFPDLTVYDQNKYTNWYKQFFGGTASTTNGYATLKGGSDHTTFIVTGGYTHSKYNFPGDFADTRYSLHSSVHHSAFNDRLTFDFGTDYSYDKNNSSGQPNAANAFISPPNLPDLLDASGNLVWNYKGSWLSQLQQYAYLKQTSDLQSHSVNTVLNVGYKITKGLRFSTNLGYSRFDVDEIDQLPTSAQSPQYRNVATATFGTSIFQTISIEPQLDYHLNIGKGVFNALLGGSYKKNLYDNTVLTGIGYSSDALLGSINGANEVTALDQSTIYKYAAAFGRLNYMYDQKYIVSLTGRRDGSSNFGTNRQFGNFGSAGLGWIFSEEKFFKNAIPFIGYAKLSASYGTSGGDGIAPYQYQSFYQPNTQVNTFQGVRPYNPVNLYNPDYNWSVKKTLNLGLDVGLLDNRILLNGTWYQSRSDNQLTNYALPSQTGFSSVLQNFNATVQNRGLEFTLTSTNIKSTDFSWTTNFNIAFNRNKLLAFPGLESSPYALYYSIGKSTSTVIGYRYKDVNPTTGLFEFYKANGEVTSSPVYGVASQGGDMVPVADLQPKFTGGFGNTFRYKNFSLTAFFQFVKQTSANYLSAIYSAQSMPGGMVNIPVAALNHWRNPGDISDLERLSTALYTYDAQDAAYSFTQSSGAYSDASYIRLKTLSLDYRVPDKYLGKCGVKNLRVYINAQNLLTITGYQVGDPQSAGSLYSFPLQRTVAGGLSFNF